MCFTLRSVVAAILSVTICSDAVSQEQQNIIVILQTILATLTWGALAEKLQLQHSTHSLKTAFGVLRCTRLGAVLRVRVYRWSH